MDRTRDFKCAFPLQRKAFRRKFSAHTSCRGQSSLTGLRVSTKTSKEPVVIEGLEHRLLLDASFNKSTGLLTVTGTNNADVITIVNKNPAIVTINGKKS